MLISAGRKACRLQALCELGFVCVGILHWFCCTCDVLFLSSQNTFVLAKEGCCHRVCICFGVGSRGGGGHVHIFCTYIRSTTARGEHTLPILIVSTA